MLLSTCHYSVLVLATILASFARAALPSLIVPQEWRGCTEWRKLPRDCLWSRPENQHSTIMWSVHLSKIHRENETNEKKKKKVFPIFQRHKKSRKIVLFRIKDKKKETINTDRLWVWRLLGQIKTTAQYSTWHLCFTRQVAPSPSVRHFLQHATETLLFTFENQVIYSVHHIRRPLVSVELLAFVSTPDMRLDPAPYKA